MKKTIGILAHVDGGKTTFSEQLLYHTGVIRQPGRVDRQDTVLDTNSIEKARGITIFADQSPFEYNGNQYYLMDTPGHVDFQAETERAVMALDYAILIVDAGSGVTAHTVTLFRLLEKYQIPVFLFLNKMDLEQRNPETVMEAVRERLTEDVFLLDGDTAVCGVNEASMEPAARQNEAPMEPAVPTKQYEALLEFAAERDEALLEAYMEGSVTKERLNHTLRELIKNRQAFLCMAGSALKDEGVKEFLRVFDTLTSTAYETNKPFLGTVYKVRHDEKGNRITFIKALEGVIKVKDQVICKNRDEDEPLTEKINEIRSYSGGKHRPLKEAEAGDLFAVTGLSNMPCGAVFGSRYEKSVYVLRPSLRAGVICQEDGREHALLQNLKVLEAEEPQLKVETGEIKAPGSASGNISVSVMGKIQLEVLKQLMADRFHMQVEFTPPQVLYKETIGSPVMGCGHYEPLRHYAEVNVRMEPGKRGSGITFESQCHVDELAVNYQNLVRTHVFEKAHRGILTGSPLTDVNIVLAAGRAHYKHTEGGDFREATYRAIRQGLEKADNILLEPWYRFEIIADIQEMGRIMSDIQKRYGTLEPPVQAGTSVMIRGRGPVFEFMDYSMELQSFTRGEGSISLVSDGYDICHNADQVIEKTGYDKGADLENTSGSVFCTHGAGFGVNWDEAESYMHCIKPQP